jgi:site-specific recombinase XerD
MWKYQSAEKLVFANPQGKAFTTLKKSWCNLLTRSQIKYFRWHDMRHSFASKLVMAGVDLNTIRELLGHADIKMTLRYAHLAPKVKAEAVERLLSPANCINEMKYETEEESKTRFS